MEQHHCLTVNGILQWRRSMRTVCVAGCWLRLWYSFSRWSAGMAAAAAAAAAATEHKFTAGTHFASPHHCARSHCQPYVMW